MMSRSAGSVSVSGRGGSRQHTRSHANAAVSSTRCVAWLPRLANHSISGGRVIFLEHEPCLRRHAGLAPGGDSLASLQVGEAEETAAHGARPSPLDASAKVASSRNNGPSAWAARPSLHAPKRNVAVGPRIGGFGSFSIRAACDAML
jgi:hypothetical protein